MQPLENVEPMDETPSGMLDNWSQEALCMMLKQLFDGRWFNITCLDSLIHGLNATCAAHGQPAVRGDRCPEYGGLRVLHTVDFDSMPPAVRAGIPSAVLRVLSLDEEGGVTLFERTRWTDVMQHIGQLQTAPPTSVEHEVSLREHQEIRKAAPMKIGDWVCLIGLLLFAVTMGGFVALVLELLFGAA
ncbi:hypothetical protein FQZ97_530460 [compost metagenome]